ncbi:MAG: hypothetical protein KBD65_01625 [Candidatus Moranbacteria bacterium]|nr:hypothetical protein [Candidatus Moranbacteria bacterium]
MENRETIADLPVDCHFITALNLQVPGVPLDVIQKVREADGQPCCVHAGEFVPMPESLVVIRCRL